MFLILKIAVRNLRRSVRRTLLTMASITFGLAVILWLQATLSGREHQMIETVTSSHTGHLEIFHPLYPENRLLQQTFTDAPADLASMLPAGSLFSRRAYFPAIASSGEQSVPLMLEGIEPVAESGITQLRRNLTSGEFLQPDDSSDCEKRQAYIGQALAELLHVGLGNKIVLMGPAADGSLGNDLLRVNGIFTTNAPDYDKSVIYTTIGCVRRISAIKGIHEVVIRLPAETPVLPVQRALQERLGAGLRVLSWMQASPRLAMILKLNEATLALVSALLFVVIVFSITNTLFMTVFERTREFGLMIALGTEPGQVRRIVLIEALLMGLVSSAAGLGIGWLVVSYHARTGIDVRPFMGDFSIVDRYNLEFVLYPRFEFGKFWKFLVGANFAVVGASLLPAYRASRLRPVETMRST